MKRIVSVAGLLFLTAAAFYAPLRDSLLHGRLLPQPAAAAPAGKSVQPGSGGQSGMLHHVFVSQGKQVPLPEGDWQIAATVSWQAAAPRGSSDDARTSIVSNVLLRLRDGAVDAAILVQVNLADTDSAWGQPAACTRADLYHARVRYSSDHDGSCAYAASVASDQVGQGIDPAWRAARRLAAIQGWELPSHWLVAAYRITDPRDALAVRYFFDPQRHQVTGTRLATWTEANWQAVGSGFRNRLTESDGLADLSAPADRSGNHALQSIEPEARGVQHLGLKTLTYRALASLTDFSVAYFFLGSAASAGGLSAVSAVASSVLYFAHELAWAAIDGPAAPRVRDLPGIGAEGPAAPGD